MVVFVIQRIIREQKAKDRKKSHPEASKKEQIMTEFYNGTKLTLKGLAKKYKTSYQVVCNIHAKFKQETE